MGQKKEITRVIKRNISFGFLNLLLALTFISMQTISSQTLYSGVKPTSPSGINYCTQTFLNNVFTYKFYLGSTIKYEYSINENNPIGTFSPIITHAGGSTFVPSDGGIYVDYNKNVYPWDATYTLVGNRLDMDSDNNNGTVVAEWMMNYSGQSWYYRYTMRIEGQTLIIHVEILSNKDHVLGIIFQQCVNAVEPHAISVPYLPFFHILKANSEYTSFFADWSKSDASEIVAYDTDNPSSDYSPNHNIGFYSQSINYKQLTDYSRNSLNETLYLTTSPNIEDVFPNIPNPISNYKNISANSILWDYRSPYHWLFNNPGGQGDLVQIHNAGINNIWLQIHNWQHLGYDNSYPNVLPANDGTQSPPNSNDGTLQLNIDVGSAIDTYGCRVGLHQNYVDYYPDAGTGSFGYDINNTAKDMNWNPVFAFLSQYGGQSYLLKPTLASSFVNHWADLIHQNHQRVNATYLDVHSSILPFSDRVDFQKEVAGSGKFRTTWENYRTLFDILRNKNNGPVQGEGGNQPFYQGYADDMDARLILPPNNYFSGKNFAVFVDFDMKKLRDKAFVHGVGYYPCFYKSNENDQSKINRQIVLEYIATELAYGHGSYIPTPDLTNSYTATNNYNLNEFIGYAQLEYTHVYSMRNTFLNANISNISYSDNGTYDNNLKSASQYILLHPNYNDINNPTDFMGQVKIVYDNGVIVYVNRHPSRTWIVTVGQPAHWFNYNCIDGRGVNIKTGTTFTLPADSGWVIYDPNHISKKASLTEDLKTKVFNLEQNFPNPFNPITTIHYVIPKIALVTLKVYNILGEEVALLVNEKKEAGEYDVIFNASNLASGIYFYRITTGGFTDTKKLILLK